jgi:hypothetical protein
MYYNSATNWLKFIEVILGIAFLEKSTLSKHTHIASVETTRHSATRMYISA